MIIMMMMIIIIVMRIKTTLPNGNEMIGMTMIMNIDENSSNLQSYKQSKRL